MIRNCERKTDRCKRSEDNIEFTVPRNTLWRRVLSSDTEVWTTLLLVKQRKNLWHVYWNWTT